MNIETISWELQQVFVMVYAALLFWSLVLTVAASIGLAIINIVSKVMSQRR